jgi:ATP-dependent RNA helicase DHX29
VVEYFLVIYEVRRLDALAWNFLSKLVCQAVTPRLYNFSQTTKTIRMAGGKKKKKPASNPARGFATTSIASKPKVELPEPVEETAPLNDPRDADEAHRVEQLVPATFPLVPNENTLTAEEFEKELEDSALQVVVEKHAQKSKRDAARQKTRLETDRRLLRSQAESLNTRKWLPPELMEEILDLVKAEGRFTGQSNEVLGNPKQVSEEELTLRLWTLQQALLGSGFVEEKISFALRHVLDISDKIGVGNKDAIWGMEEALDWLARNCSRDELPDYENWQRKAGGLPRSQSGWLLQGT